MTYEVITLEQYYMGRDQLFPGYVTPEYEANARELLTRVNAVLYYAKQDNVEPGIDEVTGNFVASGLRTPAINDRTKNAAIGSSHLTCEGIDLQEVLYRKLARWSLQNQDILVEHDLWMEDPRWTPTWVHWQSRPPKSGRRIYIPSKNPPLVAALPEQLPSA